MQNPRVFAKFEADDFPAGHDQNITDCGENSIRRSQSCRFPLIPLTKRCQFMGTISRSFLILKTFPGNIGFPLSFPR